MSGMVNLWYKGRIPARTKNVNNSDGPDFVPNMEVFTVGEQATIERNAQGHKKIVMR